MLAMYLVADSYKIHLGFHNNMVGYVVDVRILTIPLYH